MCIPTGYELELEMTVAELAQKLENRTNYLYKHSRLKFAALFASEIKELTVKGTKFIKRCFKDFTAIFKFNPDQEIVENFFVGAIKNRKLSGEQQRTLYIYGFKELVIRSDDDAINDYWEIYQKIVNSIQNPLITFGGSSFLEFQLEKYISKSNTKNDYTTYSKKIITLFSSYLKKRELLKGKISEFPDLSKESTKALILPPGCNILQFPFDLLAKLQSVNHYLSHLDTNQILSRAPQAWVATVFGKSEDRFIGRNILAACEIYNKYMHMTKESDIFYLFNDIAPFVDCFDMACALIFEKKYDAKVREKLVEILINAHCHYVYHKNDAESFSKLSGSIATYIQRNKTLFSSGPISLEEIISPVARKFIDETVNNMEVFLTHLPEGHVSPFCRALTQIHPKDSKRISTAARSAWIRPNMPERDQLVAMRKIGLLSASILCPVKQKLPDWLSLATPQPLKPVVVPPVTIPLFGSALIDLFTYEELEDHLKRTIPDTFKNLLNMFHILEQKKRLNFDLAILLIPPVYLQESDDLLKKHLESRRCETVVCTSVLKKVINKINSHEMAGPQQLAYELIFEVDEHAKPLFRTDNPFARFLHLFLMQATGLIQINIDTPEVVSPLFRCITPLSLSSTENINGLIKKLYRLESDSNKEVIIEIIQAIQFVTRSIKKENLPKIRSAALTPVKPNYTLVNDQVESFERGSEMLYPQETAGGGACGLHAINGELVGDEFRWLDSDTFARGQFAEDLLDALCEERKDVVDQFKKVLISIFEENSRGEFAANRNAFTRYAEIKVELKKLEGKGEPESTAFYSSPLLRSTYLKVIISRNYWFTSDEVGLMACVYGFHVRIYTLFQDIYLANEFNTSSSKKRDIFLTHNSSGHGVHYMRCTK